MTRTRKIGLSIVGTILIVGIGVCAHDSWAEWHHKQYGGFEAAGIDSIPGAELISYKYEAPGFIPDHDATWVYKIPAGYTDKLYRDCAAMHYETGPFTGHQKGGTESTRPMTPGCHARVERHRGFVTIEFSGERLTVHDIYGL